MINGDSVIQFIMIMLTMILSLVDCYEVDDGEDSINNFHYHHIFKNDNDHCKSATFMIDDHHCYHRH